MREIVDGARVRLFMEALGREAEAEGRAYLTGGATAVLLGWRTSTIDIDLKLIPDSGALTQALPRIKETLRLNVELAAPDQFIPPLPGWAERSRFIYTCGRVSFFHYDFYAQALSKIERGHTQDAQDVREMIAGGLVDKARALELMAAIEPEMHRYPAVDWKTFRAQAERFLL